VASMYGNVDATIVANNISNNATNNVVPIDEAIQDFSRITQIVDERGMAVILKDDEPCYVVLNLKEFEEIQILRCKFFNDIADGVINENIEALQELYKC